MCLRVQEDSFGDFPMFIKKFQLIILIIFPILAACSGDRSYEDTDIRDSFNNQYYTGQPPEGDVAADAVIFEMTPPAITTVRPGDQTELLTLTSTCETTTSGLCTKAVRLNGIVIESVELDWIEDISITMNGARVRLSIDPESERDPAHIVLRFDTPLNVDRPNILIRLSGAAPRTTAHNTRAEIEASVLVDADFNGRTGVRGTVSQMRFVWPHGEEPVRVTTASQVDARFDNNGTGYFEVLCPNRSDGCALTHLSFEMLGASANLFTVEVIIGNTRRVWFSGAMQYGSSAVASSRVGWADRIDLKPGYVASIWIKINNQERNFNPLLVTAFYAAVNGELVLPILPSSCRLIISDRTDSDCKS